MNNKALWCVPLASLFTSLLSGCPVVGNCGGDETFTYDLTPEEYAEWAKGNAPGSTTGDPTTTGGSTTGGTTDGSTTGGSTTGGSTTGGSTTDGSTTGGSTTGGSTTGEEMLTEQEICTMVCEHHYYQGSLNSCSVMQGGDKVVVTCEVSPYCLGGRRHACVAPRGAAGGPDAAAAWLAAAAHDEAASVYAFCSLGRELSALGAPAQLLAQVEAAADDEVRHAEVVSALARRGGAEVPEVEVAEVPARDLLAIAIENAVEGCVHETWAALTAAHQARGAADPWVRRIYATIAADEARHAELAWALDAWLSSQLDAEGRERVAVARRAAARALAARVAAAADAPELAALGLPTAEVAARLCAGLDGALWSRAA